MNPLTIFLKFGFLNNLPHHAYSLKDAYAPVLDARVGGPELHLWFLQVLFVYTCLFMLVRTRLKRISGSLGALRLSCAVLTGSFALLYAAYWMAFDISTRVVDYPRLMHPFIEDLPFYLAGALAGYSPAILKAFQRPTLVLAALGLGGWLIMAYYRGPGWGPAGQFGRALLSVLLVVTLNWVFVNFLNVGGVLSRLLSSSIYTVYLFHIFLFHAILALLDMHVGDLTLWSMFLLATGVVALGVGLHDAVINRLRILRFLFLGLARARRF